MFLKTELHKDQFYTSMNAVRIRFDQKTYFFLIFLANMYMVNAIREVKLEIWSK